MQLPRKSVLAGALLGLIPIALGVVALVTRQWVDKLNYGLFDTNLGIFAAGSSCNMSPKQQVIRGLEIGGVAAIAVGIVTSVLLNLLIKNRWIRLLPQLLLILGPTAILIGLILFLDCASTSSLGYSLILMIIASITGYVLAAYFAFVTGYDPHYPRSSSTIVIQESVRF